MKNPCLPTRRLPSHRSGMVYALVLAMTLLVVVAAVGSAINSRIQLRGAAQANEVLLAETLADAAVSYALAKIQTDSAWRTTYASGATTTPVAYGEGKISFRLVDETDGNLANSDSQWVRLYGIGTAGSATRVHSVLIAGTLPLDALSRTITTSGDLQIVNGKTLVSAGGSVAANGTLVRGGTLQGSAEAVLTSGSGAVTGSLVTSAPALAMPDRGVFDFYRTIATEIPFNSIGGGTGTMTGTLLSSTVNPCGTSLSPRGIYYIRVPAGKSLVLRVSRIVATLVVDCEDRAILKFDTPLCWEPGSSAYPALLIRHAGTGSGYDWLYADNLPITEASVGANLNPPGTPYLGASDNTIDDTYPSQIRGLIHIIVPDGSRFQPCMGDGMQVNGAIIVESKSYPFYVEDSGVTCDAMLLKYPPIGYTRGVSVTCLPGTWRRETAP